MGINVQALVWVWGFGEASDEVVGGKGVGSVDLVEEREGVVRGGERGGEGGEREEVRES